MRTSPVWATPFCSALLACSNGTPSTPSTGPFPIAKAGCPYYISGLSRHVVDPAPGFGVDKHCRRAQKAGAVILEAPADTECGHRRYGATDPEGHDWYFAQAIRRRRSTKRAGGAPRRPARG